MTLSRQQMALLIATMSYYHYHANHTLSDAWESWAGSSWLAETISCRWYRSKGALSSCIHTYACTWNVLHQLLSILLHICLRSVCPISTCSNEPLRHQMTHLLNCWFLQFCKQSWVDCAHTPPLLTWSIASPNPAHLPSPVESHCGGPVVCPPGHAEWCVCLLLEQVVCLTGT